MSGQPERDVERLADLLTQQSVRVQVPNVGTMTGFLRRESAEHLASQLTERDAAIRDEAKAEAWDEGEQAGRDNADDGYPDPRIENPYRALLDGGDQS